jgi:hypothetical protein
MAIFEPVFGGIFEPLYGGSGTLGPAPASATSSGTTGDTGIDDYYFYYCVATNVWERVSLDALMTWINKTLSDLLLEQTYAHSAPTLPIDFNAHQWAISGAL